MIADVPPAVVTVTSRVPAPAAGLVTVMLVAVSLVITEVAVPNFTEVALARLAPVIVTVVPPAVGPCDGLIEVTLGAGGGGAT